MPTAKYQNEGGPTPEQIIEVLRRRVLGTPGASAEVTHFVDALAFNWIIGGTDAHAKNYSILLAGDQVRLSPMYDVASVLPYDGIHLPQARMAMRIGGEYRLQTIGGRHWRRFASSNGLDPEEVVSRIDGLASGTANAFAAAADAAAVKDLGSSLPRRLVDRVAQRAEACRTALSR